MSHNDNDDCIRLILAIKATIQLSEDDRTETERRILELIAKWQED